MARRKRRSPGFPPARKTPRRIEPGAAGDERPFPTALQALDSPDLRALVRGAVRAAACSGILVLGSAGCADPVCAPSATDELVTHSGRSVEELIDLDVGDGISQLAVGLGITPHSSAPVMAGEMIAPAPSLPPHVAPPEEPDPAVDPEPEEPAEPL